MNRAKGDVYKLAKKKQTTKQKETNISNTEQIS